MNSFQAKPGIILEFLITIPSHYGKNVYISASLLLSFWKLDHIITQPKLNIFFDNQKYDAQKPVTL